MLFRNSRLRCCSAGVDLVGFGENKHQRGRWAQGEIGTGFGEGIPAASALRFPPRTYPCRKVKSDVRQPIKRNRRSSGVAIATYEETNRSGRKICTMRHFSRVAMDNSPRELTWQAEKEPIMANQLDNAPRRYCRLGYLSGGVDRPYGEKKN